jgi:U3 small nucleolar RNA-associated protein 11
MQTNESRRLWYAFPSPYVSVSFDTYSLWGSKAHRRQLLKELAARLKRDLNLRYAARELEMQRLMMGKGSARKIRGVEKVEDEEKDEEDDEDALDALDARKGKRRKVDVGMEDKPYKPRVYKWRAERKK